MNSARFATSLHILTLLEQSGDTLLSSDYLAGSININPVLVRKELSNLRNHGLVISKEGKNGGSRLAKDASKINLGEVYMAVKQHDLLGHQKNNPNPNCPVGRQINMHLNNLYDTAEQALIQKLSSQSLADFCRKFYS